MASYSIINNAVFQPFTYQELALPLMQMQQKQEALEEEYDKLSAQADVLEAMGRNDRDIASGAYAKYKAFSDELRARADALYENGLDYDSRVRLHEMKRMYNTDIVPIQNAWQKREAEEKLQTEAWIKDPSLMFSRDASKTNLDWYLDNPSGGFKTISGNTIMAQVAAACQNFADRIMVDPKEAIQLKTDDPELYYSLTRYGMRPEDVQNWQNHPALKKIADSVLAANGITPETLGGSYNDIVKKSTGYIGLGVYSALGKDEVKFTKPASGSRSGNGAGASGMAGITMDTSMYQLPMMGADDEHWDKQKDAMRLLGGKYDKNNDKVSFNDSSQEILIGYGNSGFRRPVTVDLFNSDGTLKTRDEFLRYADKDIEERSRKVKQTDREKAVSDKNIRSGYESYYDRVEKALSDLGLSGDRLTKQDLSGAYDVLRGSNAAKFANVYNLNLERGDWGSTAKQMNVRELAGYKDGKPVYKPETTTIGNLLRKKDDSDTLIDVSAHWTELGNERGLILATNEDGKQHRYFISANDMPEANIVEAMKSFDDAEIAKQVGNAEAYNNSIEDALRRIHTGLTIHNVGFRQNPVRQMTLKQLGMSSPFDEYGYYYGDYSPDELDEYYDMYGY